MSKHVDDLEEEAARLEPQSLYSDEIREIQNIADNLSAFVYRPGFGLDREKNEKQIREIISGFEDIFDDGGYNFSIETSVGKQVSELLNSGLFSTTAKKMSAADYLVSADAVMRQRGKSYDKNQQKKERSMEQIVKAFNAVTGLQLTVEQGWNFMMVVKMVRLNNSPNWHSDSAIDLIAYGSLLAESGGSKSVQEATKLC
jgi:hypothetical protein